MDAFLALIWVLGLVVSIFFLIRPIESWPPVKTRLRALGLFLAILVGVPLLSVVIGTSGSSHLANEPGSTTSPPQTNADADTNEGESDCRITGAGGLPPGLESYSQDEAFEKRIECERGNFSSCYEMCRRHLNGDRPGYTCPLVRCGSDTTPTAVPTKIPKGAIACDHLKDEVVTATDPNLIASDEAVRRWIVDNRKPCVFVPEDSDVRSIHLTKIDDGYYFQVAIKSERWHRRWATPLDFGVDFVNAFDKAPYVSDAQEKADADHAAQLTAEARQKTNAFWNAVSDGNSKLVVSLISQGIDPNAARVDGVTPLQDALLEVNSEMMRTLLSHGANPNTRIKDGKTVLSYAVLAGNVDIIKLLLSYGADPEQKDNGGWSPIDYSRMSPDYPETKIVLPLLEHAARKLKSPKPAPRASVQQQAPTP